MALLGGISVAKRNDVSVKIDAEVYRLVKLVATWKDMSVAEYLSQTLRPIVAKKWAKINRESGKLSEDRPSNEKD